MARKGSGALSSKELTELVFSEEFQAIARLDDEFDLFKALGIARKELPHSNLLAYLLDPRRPHGCGDLLLRRLLHQVSVALDRPASADLSDALLGADLRKAIVHREWQFIDLLVELNDAKIVIAIENKIWSGEGYKQIARYQRELVDRFPAWQKVIAYLTPRGLAAATGDPAFGVPCVALSWRDVRDWLDEGATISTAQPVSQFLRLAVSHLEANVVDSSKEKELIRRVWSNKDYAQTLLRLMDKRPTLASVQDEWCERVQGYLQPRGLKPQFSFHPKAGDVREIKFRIEQWQDVPVTFMLICDRDYGPWPALRVLLHPKLLTKARASLERLASRSDGLLDPAFPKLPGWIWSRVFADEADMPESAEIPNLAFDNQFLDDAFDRFRIAFEKLAALVERYPGEKPVLAEAVE